MQRLYVTLFTYHNDQCNSETCAYKVAGRIEAHKDRHEAQKRRLVGSRDPLSCESAGCISASSCIRYAGRRSKLGKELTRGVSHCDATIIA